MLNIFVNTVGKNFAIVILDFNKTLSWYKLYDNIMICAWKKK